MTDLGDIGRAANTYKPWWGMGNPITPLGAIGRNVSVFKDWRYALYYGDTSQVSVTVDIPINGTGVITLTLKGQQVDAVRAGGGHAFFYDLDTGIYYAHEAEGARTWYVEVSGASVTVIEISGGGGYGGGTVGYAFVG